MNQLLQDWLNENTAGLLKNQAKNVKLDPSTVFALASTVYFAAEWEKEFYKGANKDAVFHSPKGDLTTPFMNATYLDYTYYWSENFGAIFLELSGETGMWFILPDEGYTTADILDSDDYLRMTLDPKKWKNQKRFEINLSLPKFDVVSQMDLVDGIKAMGVTDIFNSGKSNFTPLTDTRGLAVSNIDHTARVSIDEEGCKAVAFTVVHLSGGYPPDREILDFVLDRPFLFVISSRDNLPLFAGIVNEP
jgi:serine protease inhibitor